MIYRKWFTPHANEKAVRNIVKETGISPLLAQVLVSRGYSDSEAVTALISTDQPLSDPMLMRDMDRLVERVHRAVDNGEKIVVYGDYDVDGVTATALMLTYLESVGANVFYKLPTRENDGYGLNKDVIDMLVRKKVTLVLTVDNGISAVEEAEYARQCGLDVVITDHHLPPQQLPNALAVVDPLRLDDESPAKNLSGVGVAFKTICALEGCAPEEMLEEYGDLTAIGTVADMMALTGENRTLVQQGVLALQNTQRYGLIALLESCGLADKPVSAENISFGIAPRLNAAGRMEDPSAALQLLLTEDETEASELVAQLNGDNARRQETEQQIAGELIHRIDSDSAIRHRPMIVVWGHGYHQGVIGIVASRLVERYGKPAIVFTIDENGQARGSGRSIEGFSLYSAIASCGDLLRRFGGHDLAAGVTLHEKDLPEFTRRINDYAAQCTIEQPPLKTDAVFYPGKTTVAEVEELTLLAPFGNSNPSPLFYLPAVRIESIFPVSEGRHVRLRLVRDGVAFQAVLFGTGPTELAYRAGDIVDAVLSLSVYYTGMNASVSGRIRALRPSALGEAYLDDWNLYSRFQSGAVLTAQEKQRLLPSREDVIRVYRDVGSGGVYAGDLRPMLLRCGANENQNAGRLLVALDVLQELFHVAASEKGVMQQTGGQRRPLTESVLLRSLEE